MLSAVRAMSTPIEPSQVHGRGIDAFVVCLGNALHRSHSVRRKYFAALMHFSGHLLAFKISISGPLSGWPNALRSLRIAIRAARGNRNRARFLAISSSLRPGNGGSPSISCSCAAASFEASSCPMSSSSTIESENRHSQPHLLAFLWLGKQRELSQRALAHGFHVTGR